MSPSKFYDDHQQPKKEINGTRPAPLKINKDSHLIQKSSSSSSSSNSSSLSAGAKQHHPPPAQQQRHPVIIYTHSPKVIHTKARDFMALVQKLTGLSQSDDDKTGHNPQGNDVRRGSCLEGKGKNNVKAIKHDDTMSSSVITDENCGGGGGRITDVQVNSSSVSPAFDPSNPYLSDIPLFTPNSSDFFCSSRPYYRYPDHMFSSPNMINTAISPAMLEVLKSYPDYCN